MMKVIKNISLSKFLAQALFLLLPTIVVAFFILWNSNQYFTILKEQWFSQGVYFTLGLLVSFFIYQFRFRFLPLALALVFVLLSIYKILDNYTISEFDGFFISVQFLVFSYLFVFGWICGWGLQRIKFFPLLLSGIFLIICIILISKTGELTVMKLLQYLVPVIVYAIYMIYTSEALRNVEETSRKFWFHFGKRLIIFGALLLLLLGGVVYFLYDQIEEKVASYGGQGKEGENQMLETNKDGTVQNKQSMGMNGNNNRNNNPEALFCAHINNYIPNTDIPNPLYLTSYHFSKYDSTTETFERDTLLSFNDEFVPNPSSIPLYFIDKDSSRIRKAMGTKDRKVVELEVYKKRLSPDAFIAPSTSFFVQPITVEKDFQKEFKTAYRAKSYVSEWNSAYFIYNTEDPEIRQFQERRFTELRKAKNYSSVSDSFMNYYTYFPTNGTYKPVQVLADSLAKGKSTTIDKILAVRDYFLQRNALGEKVYSYSDNPGVPGLPSASKLNYFLFESKKGYCAYYAGATVFLLRAMHIPTRVVTGFLTVDRSDKNTGWYWFYEDQSHGWVQVYFPEYGWLDFDTTVGNDEAQQSPQPDGTPPMQPPNPIFAAAGRILEIDTSKKQSHVRISDALFKDVEYSGLSQEATLDLKVAHIWKDSVQVSIQNITKDDIVMAVSYAEKLKPFSAEKPFTTLINKFPKPIPIDEIYIKRFEPKKTPETKKENPIVHSVKYYLQILLISLLILILILFLIPSFTYRYFKFRMNRSTNYKRKSYFTYKASTFLLNQLQINQGSKTPFQHANAVDLKYHTSFSNFMKHYLKLKYANLELTKNEIQEIEAFFKPFENKIKSNFTLKQRIIRFLNLNQYVQFFFLPELEK